jgi:hypothetical protein
MIETLVKAPNILKAPEGGIVLRPAPMFTMIWIPDYLLGDPFKSERNRGYRLNIRVRRR